VHGASETEMNPLAADQALVEADPHVGEHVPVHVRAPHPSVEDDPTALNVERAAGAIRMAVVLVELPFAHGPAPMPASPAQVPGEEVPIAAGEQDASRLHLRMGTVVGDVRAVHPGSRRYGWKDQSGTERECDDGPSHPGSLTPIGAERQSPYGVSVNLARHQRRSPETVVYPPPTQIWEPVTRMSHTPVWIVPWKSGTQSLWRYPSRFRTANR
jgi:hypothetical protein